MEKGSIGRKYESRIPEHREPYSGTPRKGVERVRVDDLNSAPQEGEIDGWSSRCWNEMDGGGWGLEQRPVNGSYYPRPSPNHIPQLRVRLGDTGRTILRRLVTPLTR